MHAASTSAHRARPLADVTVEEWLAIPDPTYETLPVLERADRGYVIVLVAGPGEVVRAMPFEEVEIPMEDLFLEEEGEAAAPEGG